MKKYSKLLKCDKNTSKICLQLKNIYRNVGFICKLLGVGQDRVLSSVGRLKSYEMKSFLRESCSNLYKNPDHPLP